MHYKRFTSKKDLTSHFNGNTVFTWKQTSEFSILPYVLV